jgi:hypothetical protein
MVEDVDFFAIYALEKKAWFHLAGEGGAAVEEQYTGGSGDEGAEVCAV